MMDKNKVVAVGVSFFLFILVLSVFVYAAGTSTGGSPSNQSMQNRSSVDRNISMGNNTSEGKNCESQITRLERIQCRLDQKSIDLNVTEETCRTLPNPNACRSLYSKVASCYDF